MNSQRVNPTLNNGMHMPLEHMHLDRKWLWRAWRKQEQWDVEQGKKDEYFTEFYNWREKHCYYTKCFGKLSIIQLEFGPTLMFKISSFMSTQHVTSQVVFFYCNMVLYCFDTLHVLLEIIIKKTLRSNVVICFIEVSK